MNRRKNRSGAKQATATNQIHAHYTDGNDAINKFVHWCDDNGVIAPVLIANTWVRTNAPGKGYKNDSLCAKLKDDCIHIKDWTTGDSYTFFGSNIANTTQSSEVVKHQRAKHLFNEQQENKRAARVATKLWGQGQHRSPSGYFVRKGLASTHGVRWHEQQQCWLVLLTDVVGEIQSLQRIYDDGRKLYLKGGKTVGSIFVIGSLVGAKRVLVCEGFATGCTLREKTGLTIVCAMTAGNLLTVCKALRARYTNLTITVCGDDDRRTTGNPGRTKALEAANAIGAKVAMPELCTECNCTDFNDQSNCKARGAGVV